MSEHFNLMETSKSQAEGNENSALSSSLWKSPKDAFRYVAGGAAAPADNPSRPLSGPGSSQEPPYQIDFKAHQAALPQEFQVAMNTKNGTGDGHYAQRFQEKLDKFYSTLDQRVDLTGALNQLKMSPDQVRKRFKAEGQYGDAPVEGRGNDLNIYDRENNQHRYTYNPQTQKYSFRGSLKEGNPEYQKPVRLELKTATDSVKSAIMAQDKDIAAGKKLSNPQTWADNSAEHFQKALNNGVPLNELVKAVNRALPKDENHQAPYGRDPVTSTVDDRGHTLITVRQGAESFFTLDAIRDKGKWQVETMMTSH